MIYCGAGVLEKTNIFQQFVSLWLKGTRLVWGFLFFNLTITSGLLAIFSNLTGFCDSKQPHWNFGL